MVTMRKGEESINKPDMVLYELISGVVLVGVFVQIAFLIFSVNVLYDSCGWWGGIAIACFMAFHMYRSLDNALDLQEGDAMSSVRKNSLIRYSIVVIVMVIMHYTGAGNVVTYVFGVLMLKAGAYLQPFTHKVFNKIFNSSQGDK